ncbi:hypothetical protein [Cohnella sp. 56]|uniref:hypothetical protein n=1 Tax=Cohnella sp. 56 TaxID=3113722 RepID=UPI0030E9E3F3
MKMNFKFLIYSLSLMLLISFVPSVSANNYVSEKISVTDAEQAAQKFIGYLNNDLWQDAQLKFSKDLYDIDETLLAYYFLINNKSGMNKGYIIVSATKDRGPVLEFGDGVIESDQSGLKSYFLNGIVQASSAEEILRKAKEKNLNLKLKEKTATTSRPRWDQLLSDDSAKLSIMSTVSKELSVSRYHQRMTGVTHQSSACGPTTGAMISDYLWHYYNVPGSFDYDGVPKLINHLYSEMGTSSFGTSLGDFSVGLLTHLREYGEKWVGVQYRGTDNVAWNNFQGDIDDYDFPTGIRFDFWVSGSTYTNYHFVAGIGYKIVDGTKYFGFKDPDGGSNNTGTIYRLWNDNDQDIGLLHLWKQ